MSKSAPHRSRFAVEQLEDRTAPALFGPIDSALNVGFANPVSIVAGDFNDDGRLDLATSSNSTDVVIVLLGNGRGGFSPAPGSPVSLANGDTPLSVAIGDFNSDGKLDLATANSFSNNVSVLLGNGNGGFSPAPVSPITVGSSPDDVVVGDFNGDGNQDLAVANFSSNNVTMLTGNGSGGFSPAAGSPVAAGNGPGSEMVGDFNGDGNQDLAVANEISNNVTVLLGNGSGGFSPTASSPVAVGIEPTDIVMGDFDGDRRLDLAVANLGDDTVTVLLGNGGGGFTSAAVAAGSQPRSIAVGDFNGDGKLDFAILDIVPNLEPVIDLSSAAD